ncbi:MAG: ABC transporter substrate-binding protein/permease [Lactobacillales bacterium]|jgi:putative lysine transport system permease protein|nr:ABC transporter substrate-binding protein/permease [Lactobacillales bacterium]
MNKLHARFKILIFIFPLLFALNCLFSIKTHAKSVLRVGMEAGYAPFNWTQDDDKNVAVSIDGTKHQYANGYDVQVAKMLAKKLNRKLVIVKTAWDGLVPELKSGKIDAIIAGMTPTKERRQEIDFSSNSYYISSLVIVVNSTGKYTQAKRLSDFKGAKITAQQGTFNYQFIKQIPKVKRQTAMRDFPQMRQAVESGIVDGYVAERPEAMSAKHANHAFKMVTFNEGEGFKINPKDTAIAVGMRKGDANLAIVNENLQTWTKAKQNSLMAKMIKLQPVDKESDQETFFSQVITIAKNSAPQFIRGAGLTLFIALIGTLVGLVIGLAIGVFRIKPKSSNKFIYILDQLITWLLSFYIEVFRGTPMIVQAMVIYYGTALAFHLNLDRTFAALFIVSINTGAYMSEIVRGGIFAVDKGQFEAAQALGMTHSQTMIKIVLPQVIRNILPATGNEFVINIKDTSVLNVISVVELYFAGNTVATQNFQYFQTFTIIALIYFVMTFTITRILRLIEKKIDGQTNYLPYANQMQVEEAFDNHYNLKGGA